MLRRNPGFMTVHHSRRLADVHPIRSAPGYDDLRTMEGQHRAQRVIGQLRDRGYDQLADDLRSELRLRGKTPRQVARQHAQLERQVARNYETDVRMSRPRWAHHWSQADLRGLADYAGLSKTQKAEENWYEHLKPEVISEYRDRHLGGRKGLGDSKRERAHRAARRRRNPDGRKLLLIAGASLAVVLAVKHYRAAAR